MFNKILDKTVYFSFDSSGFKRHQKSYSEINPNIFDNKTILITGGTSGIGEALALKLTKSNAKVIVTGRNKNKFLESTLSDKGVEFSSLDMCDLDGIKLLASNLGSIDHLVCNAGGMPENLKIHYNSFDTIFCSQVIGHYKLVQALAEQKKLNGACVHFNSSGGMYPVKLDLSDLKWENKRYDKVASYANAKRAQVILTEELPTIFKEVTFTCSHPGWVRTKAVEESIPGFFKFTENRLRSPDQGADTIYWCLSQGEKLENGSFYFDRTKKDPYPFFWTKETDDARSQLIKMLNSEY